MAKKTTLSYTQMFQQYSGDFALHAEPIQLLAAAERDAGHLGAALVQQRKSVQHAAEQWDRQSLLQRFLQLEPVSARETSIPTEQVNLRSSSLKWLDFNGQYQYSHAHSDTPIDGDLQRAEHRSATSGYNTSGSGSSSRWNSSSADISAIFHISKKLRLMETFRFRDFSVAGRLLDLKPISSPRPAGVRLPCSARCYVPAHDSASRLKLSGRHRQRAVGQHDRPEHEAERFPGAV